MKKILWVIPKWTFPVTDGARVATDRLIRNSNGADLEIDVLCIGQRDEKHNKEEMIKEWGVKNIHIINRDLPTLKIQKVFYYLSRFLCSPLRPITFSSFAESKVKKAIKEVLELQHFDMVVLDGLHLAASFESSNGKLEHSKALKFIYRAHNIEMDLWKKSAMDNNNPFLKVFLWIQYFLVKKFEISIMKESDLIAAISQEDLAQIKKISPNTKSELIPLGLTFSKPLIEKDNKDVVNLLFVGRLDWPPNKDGLEWFLQNVWPKVTSTRNDIFLNIVGSGDSSWLQKYTGAKQVKVTGFIKEIKDAYADCHFTIAPIFYGSGTRIKVIESYAMGRPLITTKMGIQGSGLGEESYFRVESSEEWISLLQKISLEEQSRKKLSLGLKKLSNSFDERVVGERFYRSLIDL